MLKQWKHTAAGPLPDWWYKLCQRMARSEREHQLFMADIKSRYVEMAVLVIVFLAVLGFFMYAVIFEPFGPSPSGYWGVIFKPEGTKEIILANIIGVCWGAAPFVTAALAKRLSYRLLARKVPDPDWFLRRECERIRMENSETIDEWFEHAATRPFDAPTFDIPYKIPPV